MTISWYFTEIGPKNYIRFLMFHFDRGRFQKNINLWQLMLYTISTSHTPHPLTQVTNGAGLTTISSSAAYTLDHTPPTPGHVYDGSYITAVVSDLDYSTDLSNLNSHWTSFTDPHTDVVEYFIAMGTTPGGTDVQDTISVGVASCKCIYIPSGAHKRRSG